MILLFSHENNTYVLNFDILDTGIKVFYSLSVDLVKSLPNLSLHMNFLG